MKKLIYAIMAAATLAGCGKTPENPLLSPYNTPFNTPPFDRIRPEHFEPAFDTAIARARVDIAAITDNTEAPTFEPTIVAQERAGALLEEVAGIFFNLNESETSDTMQAIAERVQPKLTEFSNDVSLNEKLFERVKAVYESRASLSLDNEDSMLLEKTYKGFTRKGAGLNTEDKDKYRKITSELSTLTLKFGQNVLAATNAFTHNITDSASVAELPEFVRDAMAQEAKDRNETGWTVTLQSASMIPLLMYSTDRETKKLLWSKYNARCAEGGENDNREIVKRITALRLELANLLGYKTYSDYVLEEQMAKNPAAVNAFLAELLAKGRPYAVKDFETIKAFAERTTPELAGEFMPWDFGYYNEKYKNETYNLNQEEIKPYLKLENVEKAIFLLAGKLYGLNFKENKQIPVYHPDVRVYEVYDAGDRFMAILYMDFFPRASKRGGAWMSAFREMSTGADGNEIRPLITLNCNFTKPTDNAPSLLMFDELETTLHEVGHALHGILAEGKYSSLTGTSVDRDFVELPSQIMENWATEKEYLDLWAVHYQTGEPMPAELIAKIVATQNYLAAYQNLRQLSFGMTDMAWHTITAPVTTSVEAFERAAMAPTQLFPFVDGAYTSTAFSHIFAGGYASGYYSYKWAEVLEADAYSLFKEKGIFSREVADRFRNDILSKGGSEDPMTLYVRFRGHKPDNTALIRKITGQ